MRSLLKGRNTGWVAVALFLSCALSTATNAQENSSMTSSVTSGKLTAKERAGLIPQRPEDISPLLNGEKIPAAILPDASGKKIDLRKAVSKKPTVLIFYRGGWCPYCSKQLSGLQQAAPELEKLGYQLIAISTDAPEGLRQSVTKEALTYTLLSDADLSLSKQIGIAFKAPEGYWKMLSGTTGGMDADLLLPVPSVFILDRMGTIHFEYINPDFTHRLNPELLKAVASSIRNDL